MFLTKVFKSSLLVTIFLMCAAGKLFGQAVSVSNYEFSIGVYLGVPNYWGDYNGGLLGSGASYRESGTTPQSIFGSDVNFGLAAWIPIGWDFSLRPNMEFGTLTYSIPEPTYTYNMSTPYQLYGAHLQYDMKFLGSTFVPYIGTGYEYLKFKVPAQNIDPEFIVASTLESFQDATSSTIPVTFGFTYHFSQFSSIFMESTLRFTSTNTLDNFQPESSTFSLQNDAIFSIQGGLRVKIFSIVRLMMNAPKPKPAAKFFVDMPIVSWVPPTPELLPIPSDDDLRSDAFLAQLNRTRDQNGRLSGPMPSVVLPVPIPAVPVPIPSPPIAKAPEPVVVKPKRTEPIKIVEPENREFDTGAELNRIEEIKKQREQITIKRQNTSQGDNINFVEGDENRNILNWDPYIPVIMNNPIDFPMEIAEQIKVWPVAQEGYYVQVYATVGPRYAVRNYKKTITALKNSGLLEDPERQVVIIQRKQFLEIRIGAFNSYEDTIEIMEYMQGTYFDSFSVLYLPDQQ